ncbi:unnamed protein product [Closterium sp. Yama58-4]|nr:unnamed protein product [Closterium sp. Yama58-4]
MDSSGNPHHPDMSNSSPPASLIDGQFQSFQTPGAASSTAGESQAMSAPWPCSASDHFIQIAANSPLKKIPGLTSESDVTSPLPPLPPPIAASPLQELVPNADVPCLSNSSLHVVPGSTATEDPRTLDAPQISTAGGGARGPAQQASPQADFRVFLRPFASPPPVRLDVDGEGGFAQLLASADSAVSSAIPPTFALDAHSTERGAELGALPSRSSPLGGVADDWRDESRLVVMVERYKVAVDCFFAVWFVLGNIWVFGANSAAQAAPRLYNLSVVFLTLSCVSYAMPFLLCATICCCLPCIITLMGFDNDIASISPASKGAAPDEIASLPCFNDCSSEEVGLLWAGTDKERVVHGEDAVCCICLGHYKDGAELRQLPCNHHFHQSCVDTWLRINASCPLCKVDISGRPKEAVDPVLANEFAAASFV